MANPIDLSNITMNPKEVQDIKEFIKEIVLDKPELNSLVNILDGVTMKTQLIFDKGLKLTGRKAGNDCSRVSSGATAELLQKYVEPENIEDLLTVCSKEYNQLTKFIFDKVKTYREKYDIQGSDFAIYVADKVQQSIIDSVWRLAFYGDTDVTASGEETAGLIDDDNIAAFSPIDGFWKQIFDAVTDSNIGYYKDLTSIQDDATISGNDAEAIFMDLYKKAPAVLRQNKDAVFYVTGQMFLGLMQYMQEKSTNFTLETTENGWNTMKFMGHKVVDMTSVFDEFQQYFEADSTNHGAYLQHRIIFTLPQNLFIATLDKEGIDDLEVFYEQKDRELNIGFGYTLDAKIGDEKLVAVAY